jgi:formamidopyrimidine-DNA glycosylase
MPELPEVEFVARQLRADLIGRVIERVHVAWARSVQGMFPDEFAARLAGRRVRDIQRRGKYLLMRLDADETLVVHRRMSGNLVLSPPARDVLYVRVAFELDDGRRLLYSDPRKFGRLALVADDDLPRLFAALGPEPLDDDFTPAALAKRLGSQRRAIKAVLLDQSVVAGLGNIYADEALYRAGIHPLRPAGSLSDGEVAALRDAIQAVLRTGIEHGGTTFGRHRDAYDEAGTNLEHIEVYRHTGQPCARCGTPIERIVVAQRGTHYCPTCQRMRGPVDVLP